MIPLNQENAPSIDAKTVVGSYITALGGEDLLMQNRIYSIKADVFVDDIPVGEYELSRSNGKFVDRYRLNDGTLLRRGTDGTISWTIFSDQSVEEPTILSEKESEAFQLNYCKNHDAIQWRDSIDDIEFIGRSLFRGKEVFVLGFPKDSGTKRYFDVHTGLLVGSTRHADGNLNSVVESELKDYTKASNGYMFPKRIIRRFGDEFTREFRTTSYEVNPQIGPKLFLVPDAIKILRSKQSKQE